MQLERMHELDLHGLTVDEALAAFVEFYNRLARGNSQVPLRIIHGYGSSEKGGKIRQRLRAFLEVESTGIGWKTGEDIERNPGVTLVYPGKLLDSLTDRLAASILEFCSIPRTESKIAGRFREYGAREIKQAVRALVRQAKMKEILKGGHATYVRSTFQVNVK